MHKYFLSRMKQQFGPTAEDCNNKFRLRKELAVNHTANTQQYSNAEGALQTQNGFLLL